MQTCHDMLIHVRSDWNDWHGASVRLNDLHDLHWRQTSGAPHELLYGYISCSSILAGDVPHWCDGGSAPHRLLVCVLKRHTLPAAYTELMRRAEAQQQRLPAECRALAAVRHHCGCA
jgi:hypothetical protein